MLIHLTLDEALSRISAREVLLDEAVVPADCPDCSNSVYRAEYAWLFHVERRLARRLDPWLIAQRGELLGAGGVLSESLANAYRHGHCRDSRLPIRVVATLGGGGILVRIEDRGTGFDVGHVVRRYREGKPYFTHAGGGLRAMCGSTQFGVFWTDGGRAIHLLHLFAKLGSRRPLDSISSDPSRDI